MERTPRASAQEQEELPNRHRHPELFIRQVAEELATEIRARFMAAFREALAHAPNLSDRMKHYLLQKDLDAPVVEVIADPEDRIHRLYDAGYTEEANDFHLDEALVVINLPSVMRSPTYTKIFDDDDDDDPVPDNFIKGINALYGAVIDPIWAAADVFATQHDIDIERVNPIGEHDNRPPGEGYYYIWRVYPRSHLS